MTTRAEGEASDLQVLMDLQRRRARMQMAGWAVLCALLAVLVVQQRGEDPSDRGTSDRERLADPVAEARWIRLEEQVGALRERIVGLEASQRSILSAGLWQSDPLEEEEVERGGVASSRKSGPRVHSPEGLSGKPEMGGATPVSLPESSFSEKMEGILARAEEDWPEGTEVVDPDPPEAVVEDPESSEEGEGAVVIDDRPAASEVVAELNRLLVDVGLSGYHCLEASAGPQDGDGLAAVTLVERDDAGVTLGSLFAGELDLEYFEPRRAQLKLSECYGMRSGVRLEFPHRQKSIEIPGTLRRSIVGDLLLPLFGMTSSQAAIRAGDAVAAAEKMNEVLEQIEHVDLRVRSIGSILDQELVDAVIDLRIGPDGEPTRTVHADRAWWELDATAAYVELHCEGGCLVVDGRQRALFRNHLSHPLRNIQPQIWRGLPAVREVTPSPDTSAGE